MKCRHCSAELVTPFIDLGSAPPSNAYLSEAQLRGPEVWLPLNVLVCDACKLVQTEDVAAHDALFTEDYAYFSSFSQSWLDHAERYVAQMIERLGLGPQSLVAEIASNDGYLLQFVAKAGIPCFGVEPTASTAAAARGKGIESIEEFFGVELGERLAREGRAADLTAANNVLAHVPDINDFVGGFAKLLKPAGVATFEFPHVLQLATHNQFDTIYHEHFSYLSLLAVERIFRANGLGVFDVETLPTHGGSLRVYAQRSDTGERAETERLQAMRRTEAEAGMAEAAFYAGLQPRAESIKNDLLAFLIEARREGKSVGAYGAAAKGNTLLNFAGVRPDLLPYVVDRNPAKAGHYMPVSRIPIVGEDHLLADKPDYILILPWNLKDEIVGQLAAAREWGGKFVIAVPELAIIA
jgi:SAM-dependent methyltransferase